MAKFYDNNILVTHLTADALAGIAMTTRAKFPVKFDGEYYDLDKFLKDHPGGVNTLKYYKGKSILHAMEKFGHSLSAYHMIKDMKVGDDELKDFNLTGEVSENGRLITKEESARDIEEIKFLEELEVFQVEREKASHEAAIVGAIMPRGSIANVGWWSPFLDSFYLLLTIKQSRVTLGRLDWSKPLLCQLDAIAPHYDKWVNTAVYRQCRLFASPLMESMTYTPWYLVPLFWIPVILYLGITQYMKLVACEDDCQQQSLTSSQFIIHIGLGVLLWTVLEYSLHRWVFHLNPGSSVVMIKFHFLIHGMHHKVPFDGLRQVFPPFPAFILSVILYSILAPFLTYSLLKLVGGLIGYLTYDMIHYYVHHGSPTDGSYLYAMKRYHSNHHFINHNKAFGISSKLWDYVFRTLVQVKQLSFSLHW